MNWAAFLKIYKDYFCVKGKIFVKHSKAKNFIQAYEFGVRGHIES